jgi:hypothetical protein
MDLARMLEKCRRDQWSIDDLDWNLPAPNLPREREEAVCQAFTDMAGIERLAGALFAAQVHKVTDPNLKAIFESFVDDEERHAEVAARLARHYDVHKYRSYVESPALVRFRPYFIRVVKFLTPEIANAYITAGELMLDVALLRSLDDYVADEMSHRAMHLINRDESRHIAIDFHMTEVYASEAHLAEVARRPWPPLHVQLEGARALTGMLWHAQAFLKEVFLAPMDKTDPTGRRVLEAFKRMQLLLRKPRVARQPFARFMLAMQDGYNHPVIGPLFGSILLRALGAEPRAAKKLFTDEELTRVQGMTFAEMAEEAVAAKYN